MKQSTPFDEFRQLLTVYLTPHGTEIEIDLNQPMCPDEFRKPQEYVGRRKAKDIRAMGVEPDTIQTEAELASVPGLPRYELEMRIDPLLGRHSLHTTIISGERVNRPGARKFTREDVLAIMDMCARKGIDVQSAIDRYKGQAGTSEPAYMRGDIHKIFEMSNKHGSRRGLTADEIIDMYDITKSPASGSCDLCEPRIYEETSPPHIRVPGEPTALIFPNLCPFIPPHYMTVFDMTTHRPDLKNVRERDMEIFLKTGKQVAHILSDDKEFQRRNGIGMFDFINWGLMSGASEVHVHAQRGGVYVWMKDEHWTWDEVLSPIRMRKESEAVRKRQKDLGGKDPFEHYMEIVRTAGEWFFEDDHVFVFAPYAPFFSDQIDVFTKGNGGVVHNYLELDEKAMQSIAYGMTKTLRVLRSERGVTDLNVLTHQGMFEEEGCYRLHWHILPRMTKIAGMELNEMYVVSCYPDRDTERKKSTSTALRENFGRF